MKIKIYDFLYLIFICSVVFIYFNNFPLNVDSSWILYVASQILEGKTLYTEIVEVNPPLIFVYSLFPAFISKVVNLNYAYVYVVLNMLLIFISIYLSYIVLSKKNFKNQLILKTYIYSILFILTIGTFHVFGEREHLLVIFILPYILFSMFRNEIRLNNKFLLLITLYCILGLNLKPHFFLIIIIIEIYYIFYFKNILYFLRWDFILILLSGFIYLLFILLFFPEFYNFALPLAVKTYIKLFNKSYFSILSNLHILISLIIILYFLFFSKKRFNFDTNILLLVITTFLFIYLLQHKGWYYHLLPFFCFSLFFLIHIILAGYIQKKKFRYIPLFLIPLILMSLANNIKTQTRYLVLEKLLETLPKNSKIQILSVDIAQGQIVLKHNQIWSSRFGALGILPYILATNDEKVKKYLFNSIYEDLIKYKPDFILYNKHFDYNFYFSENDNRIKNIYELYYSKDIIRGYNVLKKIKEY